MRVNTSTSVVLPLSSKPSNKSSSEAENYPLASYSTQVQVGEPFSADPRFAEMVQYGTQALAEAMTGLKGEKAQEAFAKKMELFGPETREHRPSAAELEKQLQMQADSIFRGPAGNILAVVYKDGSAYSHANIDLSALAASAKGLSEHEYRAAMRNGVAAALGSRAVASYYDYNKPAPTMREIHEEEHAFNRRA
ncbi:hypothetical protein [Rivihabitans pingtungensis]|uniref:Uncharacterized protein n=1 Tax=Rivihabitans pingtungensis TaxID=1054498 RepID=A0A318KTS4_9NEIS|nr:hypothetical protein [Rivihabitans pingtungensis]PXX81274.1 hypothetical protein DFR34_102113 [Rivihabitans pingtungensis]